MTKNKSFFVNQLMAIRGDESTDTREHLLTWKILDLMVAIRNERRVREETIQTESPPQVESEEENDSFLYRAGARF